MKRQFLWMLCIGVGYWMLAQNVSANLPIVAKPYRTMSARMAYLPDSTSTNQEENVFIDGVPMPEFPGGTKALVEYMVKNTRYPKELLPDSITGRVFVQFVIDEEGKVCSPVVLRSLHPLMDAEALALSVPCPVGSPPVTFIMGSLCRKSSPFPLCSGYRKNKALLSAQWGQNVD